MNRRWLILAILALPLLTFLTYIPALRNGFIWDDDDHLTKNPAITHPEGLQKIWTVLDVSRYYPLTLTNFWLQRRLWGLNPQPYHAVNIALHAANAILIFLLLRRLKIRAAWAAAALWAVHPVNVESVAWITELKNTQSGLFFFSSLLLFLRFESDEKLGWFALSLVSFAAALASKPSTVVLPLVLLLLAWWQRSQFRKIDVLRAAPFFVLSAAMSLLTIVEQRGHIERSPHEWSLTLTERIIVASKALWFYASKLIWPVNLSFIYERWVINIDSIVSLIPLFGLLAIGVCLWRYRKHPWVQAATLGTGYYVIALLPVLGFFDIFFFRYSFVGDHFQYLASLGIVALLAAGFTTLVQARGTRCAAMLISIGGLSVLSWHHTKVFRDDKTLWLDTIKKNPRTSLAYCNYGVILNGEKRYQESEQYFRKALELKPGFIEAQSNLGVALTGLGRFEEAEQALQEALRIQPNYSKAFYGLGQLYYQTKRPVESEEHFQRAILAEPMFAEAYYDLGTLLLEQGRSDEATKLYRFALSLRPNFAIVSSNLAKILSEQGQFDEALQLYERAVNDDPKTAELHYNLALAYRRAGRVTDAITQFRTAIELKPSLADGYLELGRTLAANHQFTEAIDTFRRGLDVEPRHMVMGNEMAWLMATAPDAKLRNAPQAIQIGERIAELTSRKEPKPLDMLAAAYAEAGRFEDATATAQEALKLAEARGETDLAAAIGSRLQSYAQRQPYRLPDR